jgi:hypothetical protein
MKKQGIIVRTDNAPETIIARHIEKLIESNDYEISEISGPLIENIDDSIKILREAGCDYLTVLHEDDLKFDIFEAALNNEYGHLFESIEVVPEGWIRTALREGDVQTQPAVAANPQASQNDPNNQQQQTTPAEYIIFPYNPITGVDPFPPLNHPKAVYINYISPSLQKQAFNVDGAQLFANHFKNGTPDKEALQKAPTICEGTDVSVLGINGITEIYGPQTGIKLFCNGVQLNINNGLNTLYARKSDPNAGKIFASLLKIGEDIEKKKVQINEERVKKYYTDANNSGKLAFISALIKSAQLATKYDKKPMNSDKIRAFLKDSGITSDMQYFSKQAAEGGIPMGLINSGIKALKPADKKDEKKSDPLEFVISHDEFETVWNGTAAADQFNPDKNIANNIENNLKNQKKANHQDSDTAKTEQANQGQITDAKGSPEERNIRLFESILREKNEIKEDQQLINDALIVVKNLKQTQNIYSKGHFLALAYKQENNRYEIKRVYDIDKLAYDYGNGVSVLTFENNEMRDFNFVREHKINNHNKHFVIVEIEGKYTDLIANKNIWEKTSEGASSRKLGIALNKIKIGEGQKEKTDTQARQIAEDFTDPNGGAFGEGFKM